MSLSPLQTASQEGNAAEVGRLLSQPQTLVSSSSTTTAPSNEEYDNEAQSILSNALLWSGSAEVDGVLLQAGAKVTTDTLKDAIWDPDILERLLKYYNGDDYSVPLQWACECGEAEAIRLLLPYYKGSYSVPLQCACECGNVEAMFAITGADPLMTADAASRETWLEKILVAMLALDRRRSNYVPDMTKALLEAVVANGNPRKMQHFWDVCEEMSERFEARFAEDDGRFLGLLGWDIWRLMVAHGASPRPPPAPADMEDTIDMRWAPVNLHTMVHSGQYGMNTEQGGDVFNYYWGQSVPQSGSMLRSDANALFRAWIPGDGGSLLRRDAQGRTPLHVACATGADHRVIDMLVRGCPEALWATDDEGLLPVQLACLSEVDHTRDIAYHTVGFLLSRTKALLALSGGGGESSDVPRKLSFLLHFILENDNAAVIRRMTYVYFGPHSYHGCAEVIRGLVETQANVLSLPDTNGSCPLHIACRNHHVDANMIRYLAEKQPNTLSLPDADGSCPLHIACRNHRVGAEAIRYLAEISPAVAQQSDGRLPLHHLVCQPHETANANDHVEKIRILVHANPAAVRQKVDGLYYPFVIAAMSESVSLEVVFELLLACPEVLVDDGAAPQKRKHFEGGRIDKQKIASTEAGSNK